MPPPTSGSREGLILATGVLILSSIFAWRQWVERVRREEELSVADREYFKRKDRRRFLGTSILALIGIGMAVGSLIDYRASKVAGQRFVAIWVGVAVLVCVSLVLAMIDWVANRDYALRHRRELAEARRALFEKSLVDPGPSHTGGSETNGSVHE
jgi:uncharacterized membrane protein (Fun14 family)